MLTQLSSGTAMDKGVLWASPAGCWELEELLVLVFVFWPSSSSSGAEPFCWKREAPASTVYCLVRTSTELARTLASLPPL